MTFYSQPGPSFSCSNDGDSGNDPFLTGYSGVEDSIASLSPGSVTTDNATVHTLSNSQHPFGQGRVADYQTLPVTPTAYGYDPSFRANDFLPLDPLKSYGIPTLSLPPASTHLQMSGNGNGGCLPHNPHKQQQAASFVHQGLRYQPPIEPVYIAPTMLDLASAGLYPVHRGASWSNMGSTLVPQSAYTSIYPFTSSDLVDGCAGHAYNAAGTSFSVGNFLSEVVSMAPTFPFATKVFVASPSVVTPQHFNTVVQQQQQQQQWHLINDTSLTTAATDTVMVTVYNKNNDQNVPPESSLLSATESVVSISPCWEQTLGQTVMSDIHASHSSHSNSGDGDGSKKAAASAGKEVVLAGSSQTSGLTVCSPSGGHQGPSRDRISMNGAACKRDLPCRDDTESTVSGSEFLMGALGQGIPYDPQSRLTKVMVVAAEESCTKVIVAAAEENHAKVTISSAENIHVKTTVAADENDEESRAKARRLASLPKSPAYEISWVERCKESHAKKCLAKKCRAKESHAEEGHTKARLVTAQPPLRKSLAYPEGVHFAEPYDPHKTQLDGRKDNSAHEWARAVKRSEEEARATVSNR